MQVPATAPGVFAHSPGPLPAYKYRLTPRARSTLVGFSSMGRRVDVDELIDSQAVAEILELAQPNTVSAYQRRYPNMPRPVVDMGRGRCKLWLRSEVERWKRLRRTSDS
jgi:hypothetical protein